jgi:adenylate cyclase
MGTRANVKIVDGNETVWIYRHYDGYPSAVIPDLNQLIEALKDDNVNNASEAASYLELNKNYESTDQQHGDIEYLYTVDAKTKTISYR